MLIAVALGCTAAKAEFRDFVKTRGDQLISDGKPLRFISWNIPNLHLVEDNVVLGQANPWRWPNAFEIDDALGTVRQMGGQVVRTYVISVVRTNEGPEIPRHVFGPGKFNEEAFRAMDLVLQSANRNNIRLIIPFVDNWSWWGGRAEYAGFRDKTKDDFWTDPQVREDFKATLRFILTRTNTITGVRHSEDKAILCWETGNEVESPAAWTREMAAFIKSLAPNQLVMDGFHASELREESLSMPEVDIVTTHHYPGGKKSFGALIRENAARAKDRKPYVVGEFGFVAQDAMAEAIRAVAETQTAGALAWSLRYRNRDGGYYWHSEPAGGNKYKAFHWPGSAIGDDYDEIPFMRLMRQEAFAIQGHQLPRVLKPAAPKLLPISNVGAISWQGSVGAASYSVQRASSRRGPWTTVGQRIDESFVQYRPLFSDERALQGSFYYRVLAASDSGTSKPSSVIGPVHVTEVTMVDELADFSRVHLRQGELEIVSRDCRAALEDAHRALGKKGAALVYRSESPISGASITVFFPNKASDLELSLSSDGQSFQMAKVARQDFEHGANDYGYWRVAIYTITAPDSAAHYIKIAFGGEAQLSRVEIRSQAKRK